jgi:hypothetical protein
VGSVETFWCLRCKSVRLELEEFYGTRDRIDFYFCPQCQWRFAKRTGRGLCDRWLSPLSTVLYEIIFEPHPQDKASAVAADILTYLPSEEVQLIKSEIQRELEHPTQQVRDILDMPHEEQDLREFLRLVANQLGKGIHTDREGGAIH